jgi:hypothetical protein
MGHYKYLIIDGGMTADAAALGIREVDTSGLIGLLSLEPDPPYDGPPLSKKPWEGEPIESIWRRTVEDWKEPFREEVVYYLRDGRVRGVLLWNVWGQVPNARRIIAELGPFRAGDLKGRLLA